MAISPLPASYDRAVADLLARQPQRMVPDLDRITLLLELLGRPDQAMPSIQLTGTNGKTSTSALITALLGGLDLTAGTYTSPHLQDARERIRIAGTPLTREAFGERYAELSPYLGEVDVRSRDRVTFFETLTALAFAEFADAPVDVGVVEVGLGGRWDATNLARGEVAVIGPIGLDHGILGSTPAEIAEEKVGIIKQGATVVSAAQTPEVEAVVRARVEEQQARLLLADQDFAVVDRSLAVGGQVVTLQGVTGTVEDLLLPLHGAHQAENAALALAAVEGLLGFAGGLDPDLVRAALGSARVPGRLETVGRGDEQAPVLLDGAHNPPGAAALATALTDEFSPRHLVLVLGVLGDKDVEGVVAALAPLADHLVATAPASGRAAPAERIRKALEGSGTSVEVTDDVEDALVRASGVAQPEDLVVVTGSLYTVGEARDALGLPPG